jgi:hypothetical protein
LLSCELTRLLHSCRHRLHPSHLVSLVHPHRRLQLQTTCLHMSSTRPLLSLRIHLLQDTMHHCFTQSQKANLLFSLATHLTTLSLAHPSPLVCLTHRISLTLILFILHISIWLLIQHLLFCPRVALLRILLILPPTQVLAAVSCMKTKSLSLQETTRK